MQSHRICQDLGTGWVFEVKKRDNTDGSEFFGLIGTSGERTSFEVK